MRLIIRRQKDLVRRSELPSVLAHLRAGEHVLAAHQLQQRHIQVAADRLIDGHEPLTFEVGERPFHVEELRLPQLGFFELSHDKLRDVLAYSAVKNWLYLIEAVHSANPITELRKRALK